MKPKKAPNADIGRCPCPCCGRSVPVRRNSAGKLYLICDFRRDGLGGCGMLTPNLNDGQAWIAERMTEAGQLEAGQVAQQQPVAPAEKPTPEQESERGAAYADDATRQAQRKEKGIFAGLLDTRIL